MEKLCGFRALIWRYAIKPQNKAKQRIGTQIIRPKRGAELGFKLTGLALLNLVHNMTLALAL